MKCKEILKVIKRKDYVLPAVSIEIEAHVTTCRNCKSLVLLDRLAPALIKATAARRSEATTNMSSGVLIHGIKSRIQEIRERHSSSWESAMLSMRGWLAAFALTAIVLIAVSIQWRPTTVTDDIDNDEVMTQNPAEYLISDVPAPNGLAPLDKDNPYADK